MYFGKIIPSCQMGFTLLKRRMGQVSTIFCSVRTSCQLSVPNHCLVLSKPMTAQASTLSYDDLSILSNADFINNISVYGAMHAMPLTAVELLMLLSVYCKLVIICPTFSTLLQVIRRSVYSILNSWSMHPPFIHHVMCKVNNHNDCCVVFK